MVMRWESSSIYKLAVPSLIGPRTICRCKYAPFHDGRKHGEKKWMQTRPSSRLAWNLAAIQRANASIAIHTSNLNNPPVLSYFNLNNHDIITPPPLPQQPQQTLHIFLMFISIALPPLRIRLPHQAQHLNPGRHPSPSHLTLFIGNSQDLVIPPTSSKGAVTSAQDVLVELGDGGDDAERNDFDVATVGESGCAGCFGVDGVLYEADVKIF